MFVLLVTAVFPVDSVLFVKTGAMGNWRNLLDAECSHDEVEFSGTW